ncbi:MAG: HAMP domain-containing protein [Gammaproteobacteria bacterium]|nr:HAMP domain-containing protein [Gammaproteobacteria bacterium]MBU1646447.1 HAMP domain-containing protein [Gammaproteobacteria bacterium]MBU1970990.1 HAMP domain-containing protein [Gammaproteobacteria bacterium]
MMATHASLARHNAVLLAAVFIVFELLVAAAVVAFVMAPMARRSADDLAGLMVLAAQTWNELPPGTRPDFEVELARSHLLSLRAQPPAGDTDEWRGPYLHFIETALAGKTRRPQPLIRETRNGEDWFWSALPLGTNSIAVGFPARRVGTQPLRTLLVTAGGALLLALLAAVWLARRTVGPLARLEKAVADVGRGEAPELLPETGPRELAALAARFNQMARQVDELLAARTTLLAGVSHDLRTPLARMRLALALLAEQPTPALIARMESDIEEMDRLIGKVLDLARGLEREAPRDNDLAALLADLASGAAPDSVRIKLPAGSLDVAAPPTALRRVLGNLIENALRYGNGQPIELLAVADANAIRIGVLDRGPGIPAEQMDAVFQPFHRVEASRSAVTGGSGLGLAIVRQLAAGNGWQITLRNREGGGLEAWLTVPKK